MTPRGKTAESRAEGKALRHRLRRQDQDVLQVPDRDPAEVLTAQNATRLPDLVPVRIGRMLQSPFAYYRGTAATMALDLADAPVTGVDLVICGDAHLSNFGLFASAERHLVFDLNDFDEVGYGPWEWDVKRMAASAYIGARDNGFTEEVAHEAAVASVRSYRESLAELCGLSALERYYYRIDADKVAAMARTKMGRKFVMSTASKATRRTSEQVLDKITTSDEGGRLRIVDQPPLMQHVSGATDERVELLVSLYRKTLRPDVALLMSQFTLRDYVLRVVGVGSVGTRCYVLFFEGPSGEPLFLQAKEASQTVVRSHGGRSSDLPVPAPPESEDHEGFRIVAGQRILQASSDPFLGWIRADAPDGRTYDYFVRQFRDMKGSIELSLLPTTQFVGYSRLCGALLARAHAQSPGAAVVSGYLGSSDAFDEALARWSRRYADQVEADFAAVERAVAEGRLPAERGA
jgi:uncharacterized protein (DUF2252 family)